MNKPFNFMTTHYRRDLKGTLVPLYFRKAGIEPATFRYLLFEPLQSNALPLSYVRIALSRGVEPLTSRLTVVCSNQLSYERRLMNILFVIYPFGAIFNILYTYYTKDNRPYTALTETRTRVSGFKVLSDNHYTIRAICPNSRQSYIFISL